MKLTPLDKEFHDIKEVFNDKMLKYCNLYKEELSKHFGAKTVNKHMRVCEGFIMYINDYSNALSFEAITVAEANSKFYNQAYYEGLDDFSKEEVKTKLLKFFVFLESMGVENNKVLRSLKK